MRDEMAHISRRERFHCRMEGALLTVIVALFFYRSLLAVPFLLPLYLWYGKQRRRSVRKKQKRELSVQFKDAILAILANQRAGYSVENAFRQAYEDMLLLYGRMSPICRELYTIVSGLSNNIVLEKLLCDFGKRSGIEDIMEFAEVFAAAKRSGGNMTEVMERCVSVIEEKLATEREIQVLISAKEMEQRIMNVIPFGILLYISVTSKGFFDVLYHNLAGICIMSVCLAVYVGAVILSSKIVNIEV